MEKLLEYLLYDLLQDRIVSKLGEKTTLVADITEIQAPTDDIPFAITISGKRFIVAAFQEIK